MSKSSKQHFGAVKHCVFGECNSDNRKGRPGYDPNTIFYAFPKPCLVLRKLNIYDKKVRNTHIVNCRHCKHCDVWVRKCKRQDKKFSSIANITKDICSKHFQSVLSRNYDHTTMFPLSLEKVDALKVSCNII